jgi:flagellar FliL protein
MATARLDESTDLGIEREKGSKRRLIVVSIVVAAVLLLGAGGGAAWYFLGRDGDEVAAGQKGKKGKAAQEAAKADAPQAPPIYHPLDPPFIANLPPGGKAKMVQAAVRIQTRDPALVTFLQQNDPMVRHHLLSLLGAQDAAALMTRAGREQLQADVQQTLARLVEERGGEGRVEAVYFTQFVLQ